MVVKPLSRLVNRDRAGFEVGREYTKNASNVKPKSSRAENLSLDIPWLNLYICFAIFYLRRKLLRRFFGNEYWRISRRPALGCFFITPLWIVYEILAYQINRGWAGEWRTGLDFAIKLLLTKINVYAGVAVIIPAFCLLWVFVSQKKTIIKFLKKPSRIAFMFIESLFYALIFGIVVSFVARLLLSVNGEVNTAKVAAIIVHTGSGVYEEIFFRFLLITLFVSVIDYLFNVNPYLTYGMAIAASSLLFAGSHYLEIFNEPIEISSFVFRFLAGVAFSILFILRGVGITAYTHSLYNILLMFRHS